MNNWVKKNKKGLILKVGECIYLQQKIDLKLQQPWHKQQREEQPITTKQI